MSVSTVFSDSWLRQEGLGICHININRIINKHVFFSNNLEVFGLSESKLKDSIDKNRFLIPGYLYRT